jgi:hypothetical protein
LRFFSGLSEFSCLALSACSKLPSSHQERLMHHFRCYSPGPSFPPDPLHQALNAQGVFSVRMSEACRLACLNQSGQMCWSRPRHAARAGNALLATCDRRRALLFVGQPRQGPIWPVRPQAGLWVLAELPWPLSTVALGCRRPAARCGRAFKLSCCPRMLAEGPGELSQA